MVRIEDQVSTGKDQFRCIRLNCPKDEEIKMLLRINAGWLKWRKHSVFYM